MENHFFGYPDHDENEEESTNYDEALRNRQSMIKFKDVEDEDELEREVRMNHPGFDPYAGQPLEMLCFLCFSEMLNPVPIYLKPFTLPILKNCSYLREKTFFLSRFFF